MSVSRLMINSAYVLEFSLAPANNMDVQRVYHRRRNPANPAQIQILACRVSQLSSNENFLHGIRGSEVTHRIYFAANPELREEHRLEINGLQYQIIGVPTNPSQASRLWNVDVKMITQQNELGRVIE